MLSSECFVQGKEGGIRSMSLLNTLSAPQGQDEKIKDTFGGEKAVNHQFAHSFMRFKQRDRHDRPLHGLIYEVRRLEEWLCQDRGRPVS